MQKISHTAIWDSEDYWVRYAEEGKTERFSPFLAENYIHFHWGMSFPLEFWISLALRLAEIRKDQSWKIDPRTPSRELLELIQVGKVPPYGPGNRVRHSFPRWIYLYVGCGLTRQEVHSLCWIGSNYLEKVLPHYGKLSQAYTRPGSIRAVIQNSMRKSAVPEQMRRDGHASEHRLPLTIE